MTVYILTQHFCKAVCDTRTGTFTAVFKADGPCTDDGSFRADVHMHLIIRSSCEALKGNCWLFTQCPHVVTQSG
jgi:hypothetical protein